MSMTETEMLKCCNFFAVMALNMEATVTIFLSYL